MEEAAPVYDQRCHHDSANVAQAAVQTNGAAQVFRLISAEANMPPFPCHLPTNLISISPSLFPN